MIVITSERGPTGAVSERLNYNAHQGAKTPRNGEAFVALVSSGAWANLQYSANNF